MFSSGGPLTGVADRAQAVILGLLYQLVIGFLKQILKVDQMLEIFHKITLQKSIPFSWDTSGRNAPIFMGIF